jgi:rhodanese-related sulfurtransferase
MRSLTAQEAWDFLSNHDDSVLIDVRNESEWKNGYPDIATLKKTTILLTISSDLDEFIYKLENNVKNLSTSILFLCYSGIRSSTATTMAEKAGYLNCYNISGGFAEWSKIGLNSTIKREGEYA